MKHVDVRVFGIVQGVFFRASTSKKAKELGVRGTVRNEPDGSVRIEAEAAEDVLERFLAWCRTGPRGALVERIDVTEGAVRGFDDFRVTF